MTAFTADVRHNEYLARGATFVEAIVRVTSTGTGNRAASATAAEVLIIDTSGSMGQPHTKIDAAMEATSAAIDCIHDGVYFAVVAGTHTATPAYPEMGGLALASPETRADAQRSVRGLEAGGGTAIGRWLRAADELFAEYPEAMCHAILLTDGRNETEKAKDLMRTLEHCAGRFQCDCRGAGEDWRVDELRTIASALLGTVDIIPDASDTAALTADFVAMMQRVMGKSVDDVTLRIWTPRGATVQLVQQVDPVIEDLTARRTVTGEQIGEYPTGAWGSETRDYLMRIAVPAHAVGDELLAARVSVVVGGEAVAEAKIVAIWTDDRALSTRIDDEVAAATGQAELADAIQQGVQAWRSGDGDGATRLLGHAVRLAALAGDAARLEQLAGFVAIDDAATGRVHIRPDASNVAAMIIDTRSTTKTVRRPPMPEPVSP